MNRRKFVKNTAIVTAAASLAGTKAFAVSPTKNKLPHWKGFNLLDFFSPTPANRQSHPGTTEDHLKWMQDWGFNFVRVPIAYPHYLSIDRTKSITPKDVYNIDEAAVDRIEELAQLAMKHNLHVSLNLHRAPGY
jgi:endoglucanase